MATRSENEKALKDILSSSYLLDEFIDWIVTNMPVEDVYPEPELENWAKQNDWIKLENDEAFKRN